MLEVRPAEHALSCEVDAGDLCVAELDVVVELADRVGDGSVLDCADRRRRQHGGEDEVAARRNYRRVEHTCVNRATNRLRGLSRPHNNKLPTRQAFCADQFVQATPNVTYWLSELLDQNVIERCLLEQPCKRNTRISVIRHARKLRNFFTEFHFLVHDQLWSQAFLASNGLKSTADLASRKPSVDRGGEGFAGLNP